MAAKRKSLSKVQRRVLTEWRGVEEPLDLEKYEHRLGEVLEKIIKRAGLAERCTEEELGEIWKAAVGPTIAQHSKPVAFADGILIVAVLEASVRFTLQREKAKVIARLRTVVTAREIKDVRFRLG